MPATTQRATSATDGLQAQITLRNNWRLQAAMRSSRPPAIKTLDDFDFTFQPSITSELQSQHSDAITEFSEICGGHTDYLWDILVSHPEM